MELQPLWPSATVCAGRNQWILASKLGWDSYRERAGREERAHCGPQCLRFPCRKHEGKEVTGGVRPLLAGQDTGLKAGFETLRSLSGICKACSLPMEGTQLPPGTQPPEVFFYLSDSASRYTVLPILPCEVGVVWPSQSHVQRVCWNTGFKMLWQAAGRSCQPSFTLPQRQAGETRPLLTKVSHLYAWERS